MGQGRKQRPTAKRKEPQTEQNNAFWVLCRGKFSMTTELTNFSHYTLVWCFEIRKNYFQR